jgi:hypothetical protein
VLCRRRVSVERKRRRKEAHVELGIVRPVLAVYRDEGLVARERGVEERRNGVREDTVDLVRRRAQAGEYGRRVRVEQRDDRRNPELVEREERAQEAERVDVRRGERERDLFVCLAQLRGRQRERGWGVRAYRGGDDVRVFRVYSPTRQSGLS